MKKYYCEECLPEPALAAFAAAVAAGRGIVAVVVVVVASPSPSSAVVPQLSGAAAEVDQEEGHH